MVYSLQIPPMETNSGVERAGTMHVSTLSTLQRHSVVILNDAFFAVKHKLPEQHVTTGLSIGVVFSRLQGAVALALQSSSWR